MGSVSVDLCGMVVEGGVGVIKCFSEYECDRVKSALDFFLFLFYGCAGQRSSVLRKPYLILHTKYHVGVQSYPILLGRVRLTSCIQASSQVCGTWLLLFRYSAVRLYMPIRKASNV